ncbi:protein FAM228A [Gymnodraco acuticeps]|uniref:Protein FAM228A n=1 Tax=Gymnodraco acuticeps TaxID=8218 RepID=A0A6P8TQ35_GYMAC|nr:protein FAM228A [Gymnodraco acuticeps]
MSTKKKNTPSGVITFHTHFPVGLLKSEERMVDVKGTTESRKTPMQPSMSMRSPGECVRAEESEEASPSGSKLGGQQGWLSHTSLRRLQRNMEAENQQVKEITQPLLDTEHGFVKELEKFLIRQDFTELRRRELLHKRWTERVWFPLQRRVEEHVSSCGPAVCKGRQSLYSHFLHHCNSKGFVFLEHYDVKEYDPFLLHIKKPRYLNVKLGTADLKEPLCLQLHERLKEKRTASSCEAGFRYTRSQVEKLPQSNILLQAFSHHPVTAARNTPVVNEAEGRKSNRFVNIPYRISSTATPDGRCHRNGCLVSKRGCPQRPASLQQHQSLLTSK